MYISMVAAMKKTVRVQLNRRRRPLQREALKYSWLSIQIHEPMMKVRSGISRTWNLQETPWTQEIMKNMKKKGIMKNMKKNMKIPRKKEESEQPVILSRITRLPA
jgi:hypothetical protein